MLREKYDQVPINSEPTNWLPSVKIDIGGETFYAHCDIISKFCLMPRDIYESLNLWGLSEGGGEISLNNNDVILPIGIAKEVHTIFLGRMVSTDYFVIECLGKGQITLVRSLLKFLGARIDFGEGIMIFTTPQGGSHRFPMKKLEKKRGMRKASAIYNVDASSLDNT